MMFRNLLLAVLCVLSTAPAVEAGIFFRGGNTTAAKPGSGHRFWGNRPSCFRPSFCGPPVCNLNPCEQEFQSCVDPCCECCEEVCDQCGEPIHEITGCECLTVEGATAAEGTVPLAGPGGFGGGSFGGGFGGIPAFPFGGGGGGTPFFGGGGLPPFVGGGFTPTPFIPPGGGLPGGIPGGGFSSFPGPPLNSPTPPSGGGSVPEPSSLLICAAGGLSLALIRRRRRR